MASSPEHLQALIDALSSYCAVLHMEISVLKTKVMIVSPVPAPAVAFSCNDNPIEQVTSFKYLGLHFHQTGAVAHLVTPIKSKAGGSWAAVQRWHSLLQCGKTINLHLHLLQAVLVSVLLYGCQVWGMHSTRVATPNCARLDLQRLYDYYLRTICGLLPSTPRRMLLAELGLLPCKCYGGGKLCDFGTAWLHCRWVPFTTRFAWTILLMPFRGVLAIWPALWLVA